MEVERSEFLQSRTCGLLTDEVKGFIDYSTPAAEFRIALWQEKHRLQPPAFILSLFGHLTSDIYVTYAPMYRFSIQGIISPNYTSIQFSAYTYMYRTLPVPYKYTMSHHMSSVPEK